MKRLFAMLALLLPIAAAAETPLSCTAFEPVVSCNAATGQPVVTLTNTLSAGFDPDQVRVSSLSEGVVAIPNPANPLTLQLTGAQAGETVVLNLSAIATGAGSAEGLDKCCMGDVSVNIPAGFVCEVPHELSLSHVCTADPAGADALDVLCEITLHYAGAAPTASDPLLLTVAPKGAGWSPIGEVLASDAWVCGEAVAGNPIACHLDASLDPLVDWRDFSTTVALAFRTPASFENCVTASIGPSTANACWSTDLPRLQIAKLAPEACAPGDVCSFDLEVSNPGSLAYDGPLSIEDGFRRSSPPSAGLGEFTAIDPPLCAIGDLNSGLCAGNVSLAAGAVQRYRIDWTAPDLGASYSALNCARVVSLAGTALGDDEPYGGIEGLACAEAHVVAHVVAGASRGAAAPKPVEQGNVSLHLVKTAEPCTQNVAAQTYSCPFTLTLNNSGDADFIGPLVLSDSYGDAKPAEIATPDPDWTCAQTDQGAICDTPQISLAAQASFALPVSLTLPGLRKGGSLTNCAGLGMPEADGTAGPERVAMVQRILALQGQPIGPADGKTGPKTRAAVAALRADLGLEPSGGIDADLFASLLDKNAFAQEKQSCVTVDLAPMPAPPLVCDRATAVKASGVCQCRFDGMVRAGKTACGCAKGSSFVGGKGCVKSKTPAKNQPKTPTKTPPKQPDLRICPNGLPEIPGIGCVNIDILKKRGGKAAGSGCADPTGLQCG